MMFVGFKNWLQDCIETTKEEHLNTSCVQYDESRT